MTHATTVAGPAGTLADQDGQGGGVAAFPAPPASPAGREGSTRETDWLVAVHEGLRVVGLLAVVVLFVLTVIPVALQRVPMAHPTFRIGLGLLTGYLLAVAAALWTRARSRVLVAALLVAMIAALALMVPFRAVLQPNDIWSPGMWTVPVQVLGLVTLDRRDYRRYAIATLVGLTAVEATGPFFWQLTNRRLVDSLIILEPIATLHIYGIGLLAMARRHDRGAAKAQQARASQVAQTAEAEGRREAARVLHDHVLHSLHAIAEDRCLASAEEAVDECRSTLERLDRPPAVAQLSRLEELVATDPVAQRLGAVVLGATEPLPSAVAGAMAAATHEALSNAERHAQAEQVRVEVETDARGRSWARIIDNGRGFDVGRRARGRLGLQRSVHERMQDVGGRALVTSRPGHGTVVELQWPAPEGVERQESNPWATMTAGRFTVLAALPSLLTCVVLMALMAPRAHGGVVAILITCLMLTLAFWEVARPASSVRGARRTALLLASAFAAWVAVLATAPHDELVVYHLYAAWGATAVVQIVVVQHTKRVATLMCWAMIAVLIVGSLVRYTPSQAYMMNGAMAAGLILYIGYRALWVAHDIASLSEEHTAQLEQSHLDVARMHSLARLDQFWSERVTGDALPLIRGVAEGTVDVADPQVRALARITESLVRDELVLGPGQRSFSEQLHHLRIDGWVVQSSLSRDDGATVLETAGRLVGVLGPATHPDQVVTLSSIGEGVNAVILDATPEQSERWLRKIVPLGGTMDTDPDFVRLQLVAS